MEGSKRNRGRDLAFSKHQQWYEILIPHMGKMRPGEDMAVSSNTQRVLRSVQPPIPFFASTLRLDSREGVNIPGEENAEYIRPRCSDKRIGNAQ